MQRAHGLQKNRIAAVLPKRLKARHHYPTTLTVIGDGWARRPWCCQEKSRGGTRGEIWGDRRRATYPATSTTANSCSREAVCDARKLQS